MTATGFAARGAVVNALLLTESYYTLALYYRSIPATSSLRPFQTSSVYRDEWRNHPLLDPNGGSHASPYFS